MKKMSKNVLFVAIGVLIAITIDVAAEAVISSGAVSYSNTTVSAALDELFSAVDINEKIGDISKISGLGDGTITGAIDKVNYNMNTILDSKQNNLSLYMCAIPVTLGANEAKSGIITRGLFGMPNGAMAIFASMSQYYDGNEHTILQQDWDFAYSFSSEKNTNDILTYKLYNNSSASGTAAIIFRVLAYIP